MSARRHQFAGLCSLVFSLALGACEQSELVQPAGDESGIPAGGATTVYDAGSNAFSTPAPNLSAESLEEHLAGDAAFEQVFVTAPAQVNEGLGPTYNNVSCISCHVRDGRGRPPDTGEPMASLLFRVSLPTMENQSPSPELAPNCRLGL
jgi:CxxC motif-containing protein (DUF1111 family)